MHLFPIHFCVLTLLLSVTGLSLPLQAIFHSVHNVQSFTSDVTSGDDAGTLLLDLAAQLDRGMPDGWQRLANPPNTSGSTDVQTIHVQDLGPALDAWGLPDSIRGQARNDILNLIDLHASESTFVSQNFLYNVPGCNGGDLPVCLYSLMLVVCRQPVADALDAVNIWHVFIASNTNAIQQFNYGEKCHSCSVFFRCCHDTQDPRDFDFSEMDTILALLSTSQATWARDHLPTETAVLSPGIPTRHSTTSSLLTQDTSLPDVLHRFVDNDAENEDVFRPYDDPLLSTLQGSMHSAQKKTKSFSLSLKKQDLGVIDNLLSSCLQESGINLSVQQLWQQAQGGSLDKPFSLECQHIQQKRIIHGEPVEPCNKSATYYIDTQQSWVLLSPLQDTIDCIYMEATTEANHSECEIFPPVFEIPENHSPKLPQLPRPRNPDVEDPDLPRQGSIVRWSIPQHDGRFSPVRYLSKWSAYSREVNKAAMDIVRFLSADAFLRSPAPHLQAMHNPSDVASPVPSVHNMMDPATMMALGTGLGSIADGWDKFSKAIFGSSSEKVTRQICLGFEKYEHSVRALMAESIPQEHLLEAVDALLQLSQVQPQAVEDLRKAMIIVEYSTNLTWSGETAQYTSSDGSHSFLLFYKHQDPKTSKIDLVFGTLKADFKLAQDILVIERKEVGFLGSGREETVEFKGVPHDVTLNDAALLNKYFEVVAYRQLAPMLGLAMPEYPTLPPCQRNFSSFFW